MTSWVIRRTALAVWNSLIDAFTKAIKIDSEHLPAYVGRAKLYKEMGEKDLADEDFKNAKSLLEANKIGDFDGEYIKYIKNSLDEYYSQQAAEASDQEMQIRKQVKFQ